MIDHIQNQGDFVEAMVSYSEQQFIRSIRNDPGKRNMQELQIIYSHLANMDALSKLRESALRALCTMARYERHAANDMLYCRGEMASCWYILLSGAVFIDGQMFLPRSSFGKRIGGAARRHNECLILEPSEMIVIDYVDGRARTERITDSSSSMSANNLGHSNNNINNSGQRITTEVTIQPANGPNSGTFVDDIPPPPPPRTHHLHNMARLQFIQKPPMIHPSSHHHHKITQIMRSSHSSDSSSAYSGSDTMQSSVDNEGSTTLAPNVDLSGLMESVVDSDEDDEEEEEEEEGEETSLIVRDAVRECLEKDPTDRTEEDVDILLEFTQHLKAFTNMTLSVRRALVATMVFAVVEKAGTVVMTEGEELDSWSVIINGQVEIQSEQGDQPMIRELGLGDSFGITPTMNKLYHRGVMRTKCDDCQFVCVTQTDYYRILHQGVENQKRHENESGDVVLVTEHRQLDSSIRSRGHVVIRGTPERLTSHLMEDNSDADPTFVEDFLLTYRTFTDSPVQILKTLLDSFENDINLRDKVTRVLLLWVNNHFTDFETDPKMMEYLERFEGYLESEKMQGQLRMLNFACAAKARKRTLTLTRPSREEPLQFSIMGGYEKGYGIFVSKVEKGSKADDIGLKRGDQILEVNGQSFEHVTKQTRALEILKGVCHLSITVKSNLLAFNEMLQSPEDENYKFQTPTTPGRGKRKNLNQHSGSESTLSAFERETRSSDSDFRDSTPTPRGSKKHSLKPSRLNKAFNRFLHKPKSMVDNINNITDESHNGGPVLGGNGNAYSNPDLTSYSEDSRSEYPEHVLKVYKADQSFKYLLVHKETTAHEVVMLSLQEFGITESSSNFTLCEVSVSEGGFVKQRRLPDTLQNLAERIGLASRYYIKNIQSSDSLLPDDCVNDLTKEIQVNLLQLNPVEVSTQLMVEDFTIFRQIEATEYVEDLFEIKSRYGIPSLSLFSELVNREMMWTISEIVSEPNATKRMRIIKQYIKIARQCKETQNFNSMFAIISGLGHGAVSRLKSTWEKLPSKYQRIFNDMQQLMDPSRNMSRYRNLISGDDVQPPIIPFYPVVKKDLTFINLANDSKVENLVNFEKLRMIAKEVRCLTNMCSAPLDLFSMLELGGQQPSNAMVAMNQLTAGGQYLATVNRRRKKTTGLPNPKRMFEEAQMVRRVKAYLNNMKIITDEDKLHQMSLECEAPSGTVANVMAHHTQPSFRKRNPSPTPSALSNTSSSASHNSNLHNLSEEAKKNGNGGHGVTPSPLQSPQNLQLIHSNKFGASSPQSMKKLLSLSEQSKTRPKNSPMVNRKPGSGTTSGGNSQNGGLSSSTECGMLASNPVDLTAESSSVTSLPVHRKIHKNSGSIASNDSGLGFYCDRRASLNERSGPNASEFTFSRHSTRHHHHHHHHHHHQGQSNQTSSGTSPDSNSPKLNFKRKNKPEENASSNKASSCSQNSKSPIAKVSVHHAKPASIDEDSSAPTASTTPGASPQINGLFKPHSLLHTNNFARLVTSNSRLNAVPPLPPPKLHPRGSTVPTYYIAEPEDDEDEETQVSAV